VQNNAIYLMSFAKEHGDAVPGQERSVGSLGASAQDSCWPLVLHSDLGALDSMHACMAHSVLLQGATRTVSRVVDG